MKVDIVCVSLHQTEIIGLSVIANCDRCLFFLNENVNTLFSRYSHEMKNSISSSAS